MPFVDMMVDVGLTSALATSSIIGGIREELEQQKVTGMVFVDFNPLIVNSYYVIFVTVAVFMNSLVIYLISYRSPQIVRNLKAMLINASTIQIIIALMAGFLQGRMLWTTTGTAFLPVGPCRMFGPVICFVTYNVINALTLYVQLLIVHTIYCRYRMLQSGGMRTENVLIGYVMIAILPIILLILPHIGSLQFDIVMEQAIREHPDHNLKNYGDFGGFKSSTDPIEAANSLISFGTAVISPILMLYLRRRILKTLNRAEELYTEKTVQSSRMFLKALTFQAMVPIICFTPINVLFVLTRVMEMKFVLIEYLLNALIVLPCVVDPLCAIYFVPSFREWLLHKLCKSLVTVKKQPQVTTVSTGQGALRISRINVVTS